MDKDEANADKNVESDRWGSNADEMKDEGKVKDDGQGRRRQVALHYTWYATPDPNREAIHNLKPLGLWKVMDERERRSRISNGLDQKIKSCVSN